MMMMCAAVLVSAVLFQMGPAASVYVVFDSTTCQRFTLASNKVDYLVERI